MGGKKCYAILATPPPSLAETMLSRMKINPKLQNHPLCSSLLPSAVSPLVILTRFSSRHPQTERGWPKQTLSLSRLLNHCFPLRSIVSFRSGSSCLAHS
jgi:hypothetical protein